MYVPRSSSIQSVGSNDSGVREPLIDRHVVSPMPLRPIAESSLPVPHNARVIGGGLAMIPAQARAPASAQIINGMAGAQVPYTVTNAASSSLAPRYILPSDATLRGSSSTGNLTAAPSEALSPMRLLGSGGVPRNTTFTLDSPTSRMTPWATSSDATYTYSGGLASVTLAAPTGVSGTTSPPMPSNAVLHTSGPPGAQLARSVLKAPEAFNPTSVTVLQPTPTAQEAQLRALFDTADSNHSGVLEWNTGEVSNFGKAILESCGRSSEGRETLLYNAYDDVDRNLNARMDLNEAMEFAKKVLEYSSAKPAIERSGPDNEDQNSKFDSMKSVSSSLAGAEGSFPYSGNVFTPDGLKQYVVPAVQVVQRGMQNPPSFIDGSSFEQQSQSPQSRGIDAAIGSQLDTMDFAAFRSNSNADEYMQRLEGENGALMEESKLLANQVHELTAALRGEAELAEQLSLARSENADLSQVCKNLQDQLFEQQQAPSNASEEHIVKLAQENQQLLEHIQNVESASKSEANLSHELAQALQRNAHLETQLQELEQNLMQALEAPPATRSIAPPTDDPRSLSELEEREKLMSAEIDRLQAENAALQQKAAAPRAPDASAEQKKQKYLCC